MSSTLPIEELDEVVKRLGDGWEALRNADVLVTGGTGFFGVWLISALLRANTKLGLGLRVHIASRRPDEFFRRIPEYRDARNVRLIPCDTRTLTLEHDVRITHIIHAATSASASLNDADPAEMAHIAAEGTRRVLELAKLKNVARVLFTSSGAVYGKVAPEVTHVREEQMGTVDPLSVRNAYCEGKRLAEFYCAAYREKHQVPVVIARCFAFVGPFLPLDTHFAIGNFIRNALRGEPIIVQGDGSPYRSYLYASDLAWWLLALLLNGQVGRAYNVGSERDLSVGALARLIGEECGVPVEIRGSRTPGKPAQRYVPSNERIRQELGVSESVGLAEAVRRTMAWNQRSQP